MVIATMSKIQSHETTWAVLNAVAATINFIICLVAILKSEQP